MKRTVGYIKESRMTIALLLALFLCGIVSGFMGYSALEEETKQFVETLKDLMVGESKLATAFNIFLKNVQSSFITLILGPTIIIPLLIVFLNGFTAGLVSHMAIESGKTLTRVTLSLIPHGIFELTAFFLTVVVGMKIGYAAVKPEGKPRVSATAEAIKQAVGVYVKVVLPLLLLSAFIETYISTQLIQ